MKGISANWANDLCTTGRRCAVAADHVTRRLMVQERTRFLMLSLMAGFLALTHASCMVDQSGFEVVQRYPIDMGYGLHIQDKHLYATTNEGIEFFEMNSGGRLTHLQSIEIGSPSFAVVASGNIVYVGGEGGLTVVETPSASTYRIMGKHETSGSIYSLSLKDSLLYMTDYHRGFSIVDISEPANPVMVGHVKLEAGSWDHEVAGDLVFQANTTEGLLIIDIADPSRPELLGTAESSKGAKNITIDGDTLYLGTFHNGLRVFDVSDRRHPRLVRALFQSEEIGVFHVDGGLFYGRQDKGVVVYDIGDVENPVKLAHFNTGLCHGALYYKNLVYFVGRELNVIRLVRWPSAGTADVSNNTQRTNRRNHLRQAMVVVKSEEIS